MYLYFYSLSFFYFCFSYYSLFLSFIFYSTFSLSFVLISLLFFFLICFFSFRNLSFLYFFLAFFLSFFLLKDCNCYNSALLLPTFYLKKSDEKLIDIHFHFQVEELYCELNYHDQKIRRTLTHDIRKHWTAVSTLLGMISSVYHDLHHWRSNQRPQIEMTVYTADET